MNLNNQIIFYNFFLLQSNNKKSRYKQFNPTFIIYSREPFCIDAGQTKPIDHTNVSLTPTPRLQFLNRKLNQTLFIVSPKTKLRSGALALARVRLLIVSEHARSKAFLKGRAGVA